MDQRVSLKCLEFFGGIGGFHYAFKTNFPFSEILAVFDINTVTNTIYKENFPNTKIVQRNIQALSAEYLDKLCADLWTMSPPCQPFTRKGAQRDLEDRRCDALKSLCVELRKMRAPPEYVFVENVGGFETSVAHELLVEALNEVGYFLEEYLVSPVQLGIPNSRPRYYLLAVRNPGPSLSTVVKNEFPETIQARHFKQRVIGDFLDEESDHDPELLLENETVLKYAAGISFVAKPSKCSSCFTKSYSLYLSGSGSIVVMSPELQVENPKEEILRILAAAKDIEEESTAFDSIRLRYFSWREVANLLGFPPCFQKPNSISNKQMYRALGNSINVTVVAALLQHLLGPKQPF